MRASIASRRPTTARSRRSTSVARRSHVENARTRAIRDAEDNAIIRACGSRENWEKQVEATRLKILAQVEKSRAALLASAKPHL